MKENKKNVVVGLRLNEIDKIELFKIAKKEGYPSLQSFLRARLKRDFSQTYRSQLKEFQHEDKKNNTIVIKVTKKDKAFFIEKANKEGYENLSSFVRDRLYSSLSEEYIIEIDTLRKLLLDTIRTRQAIGSLTSNINQTLKAYNSGEHPSKWIERDLSNRENLLPEIKFLINQNNQIIKNIRTILNKKYL